MGIMFDSCSRAFGSVFSTLQTVEVVQENGDIPCSKEWSCSCHHKTKPLLAGNTSAVSTCKRNEPGKLNGQLVLVSICSRSSRRSKTEETKHLFEGGKSRTNITGKVTKNADSTSFLQITL